MADISTLVDDIHKLFDSGFEVDRAEVEDFGKALGLHVAYRINEERGQPTLRMSNIGHPDRKLWYTINAPELGEDLPASARIKFLFGDLTEELLLFLAVKAGHSVEGLQSKMEVNGVQGHRDAIIDGMLVDVKSASSFAFRKFKEGRLKEDDPFGYIAQQNLYLKASQDDPLLKIKDKFAFLVMDKTLGHICLDVHEAVDVNVEELIEHKKRMLAEKQPPERCYPDEPDGKSGNRKLNINCSYCPFKQACWPGLQTYYYSNGPRYLTKVAREPKVERITPDAEF